MSRFSIYGNPEGQGFLLDSHLRKLPDDVRRAWRGASGFSQRIKQLSGSILALVKHAQYIQIGVVLNVDHRIGKAGHQPQAQTGHLTQLAITR